MIAMLLMFTALTVMNASADETGTTKETVIQLLCSPELTVLANDLADQYMQDKDGVSISVAETPDNGEPVLWGEGKIALVTKGTLHGTEKEQLFRMVIGRQVIVPVINIKHPQKDMILQKGISPEQFASMYKVSGITWGSILETTSDNPVNAYVPGDPGSRKYLADFMKATPAQIKGREIGDAGTMLARIETDPNAIGFCSMATLLDREQNGKNSGICLVPVDVDGNGQLTQFENIYADFSDLSHGIYVGKYPRELYSRVYAVTEEQDVAGEALAFLEWVISGGQASLASSSMMKLDFGDWVSGKEDLICPVTSSGGPAGKNIFRRNHSFASLHATFRGHFVVSDRKTLQKKRCRDLRIPDSGQACFWKGIHAFSGRIILRYITHLDLHGKRGERANRD